MQSNNIPITTRFSRTVRAPGVPYGCCENLKYIGYSSVFFKAKKAPWYRASEAHTFSGKPTRDKYTLKIIAAMLLFGVASMAWAEVKLKLDETEITGARELPKVLYIVPWKTAAPDSRPLPMRSLLDEVLSPVDMDVFRRQVRYHRMTHASPDEDMAE